MDEKARLKREAELQKGAEVGARHFLAEQFDPEYSKELRPKPCDHVWTAHRYIASKQECIACGDIRKSK